MSMECSYCTPHLSPIWKI